MVWTVPGIDGTGGQAGTYDVAVLSAREKGT